MVSAAASMTPRLARNLALLIRWYLTRHQLDPITALGVLGVACEAVKAKLNKTEKETV